MKVYFSIQRNGSASVPQFGAWEQNSGKNHNFSMVFSQARANKQQHRQNLAHHSPVNEQEMAGKHQEVSPRVRNTFFFLTSGNYSYIYTHILTLIDYDILPEVTI